METEMDTITTDFHDELRITRRDVPFKTWHLFTAPDLRMPLLITVVMAMTASFTAPVCFGVALSCSPTTRQFTAQVLVYSGKMYLAAGVEKTVVPFIVLSTGITMFACCLIGKL